MTAAQRGAPGRIVTFYSYKGGTGRSMAVANVAWVLASNGKRVLVLDWDLEAPGLHRYFHPFLADQELTSSPGLIDYLVDFTIAARQESANQKAVRAADAWWKPWTRLTRYSYSLEWEFPGEGTIDFVPAGQQGPTYGVRVTSFDWQEFYEKLGGGVLLEGLKQELRASYDFILIDSRTGISDTSGICTIQMPDDLVLCFTFNRQSIDGAAAVAASALTQRRTQTGEPSIRIWPVPTRIELAEKERLDAARDLVRTRFQRCLSHLTRRERAGYWGTCEVLYQPFYAYEEVLAVFGERPGHTTSILTPMENIARRISDGEVTHLEEMPEERRQEGLRAFVRTVTPSRSGMRSRWDVFLSYSPTLRPEARLLGAVLGAAGLRIFDQEEAVPPGQGQTWRGAIAEALAETSRVVVMIGPGGLDRWQSRAIEMAVPFAMRLIPALVRGVSPADLPPSLSDRQSIALPPVADANAFQATARRLADAFVGEASTTRLASPPEDPHKGRWGGTAERNGCRLSATVREISPGWFEITLEVSRRDPPLEGQVEFHLHPSLPREVERVAVHDGKATLRIQAYGASTVGAVVDGGTTTLELDLAQDKGFPALFRER